MDGIPTQRAESPLKAVGVFPRTQVDSVVRCVSCVQRHTFHCGDIRCNRCILSFAVVGQNFTVPQRANGFHAVLAQRGSYIKQTFEKTLSGVPHMQTKECKQVFLYGGKILFKVIYRQFFIPTMYLFNG